MGFVYMFGLPIFVGVLLFKITDNHGDDINRIKSKIINVSESPIFKLLSTIFFSLLFSLWAELYYGIVMEQIKSGAGRIAYLIFSGVIPVRFLLLIEPPFRPANLFFGTIAILVFVLRYI